VFWEVKSHDREIHEKAADFNGYCLRVIPLKESGGGSALDRENSFTVPVSAKDTAWYLGFPPAEGRYQVELCALRGAAEIPLTISWPFKMPRLLDAPKLKRSAVPADTNDLYQNPLVRLSGIHDFSIIRSADRRSRAIGSPEQMSGA
jgi:hypothetical protein